MTSETGHEVTLNPPHPPKKVALNVFSCIKTFARLQFPHSTRQHLMWMYDMIGQNICKIEIYIVLRTGASPSCIIQPLAPEPCLAALLTWQFIFPWCPLQIRFTLKSAWAVRGKGRRGLKQKKSKKKNSTPSLHNNQHLKCKSAPDDDITQPILVASVLSRLFGCKSTLVCCPFFISVCLMVCFIQHQHTSLVFHLFQ